MHRGGRWVPALRLLSASNIGMNGVNLGYKFPMTRRFRSLLFIAMALGLGLLSVLGYRMYSERPGMEKAPALVEAADLRKSSKAPYAERNTETERVPVARPPRSVGSALQQNSQVEDRFLTAGSLDGGAVVSALALENFGNTVASFRSVAAGNTELAARNERMQRGLTDALRNVDGDASLREFACTRNLCVLEVEAVGDRRQIEYSSYLQDEMNRSVSGIHTSASRSDLVNGVTSSRSFFSTGPAIRSVRLPDPE